MKCSGEPLARGVLRSTERVVVVMYTARHSNYLNWNPPFLKGWYSLNINWCVRLPSHARFSMILVTMITCISRMFVATLGCRTVCSLACSLPLCSYGNTMHVKQQANAHCVPIATPCMWSNTPMPTVFLWQHHACEATSQCPWCYYGNTMHEATCQCPLCYYGNTMHMKQNSNAHCVTMATPCMWSNKPMPTVFLWQHHACEATSQCPLCSYGNSVHVKQQANAHYVLMVNYVHSS